MKDTHTITLTIQIEATPIEADYYIYDLLKYSESRSNVTVNWITSNKEQERT